MNRREFLARTGQATALALGASSDLFGSPILAQQRKAPPLPASGPLRVSARNPRYFCDAGGRPILLVGSHTWNSLVDMGRSDPPEAFDSPDLDNVLYEVINEGGEKEWDWWVVETVRQYERTQPHQHPIGITGHGAERLESMLASPADWISPGSQDGYKDDPPAWDGKKVSLLDTDHVWGVGGNGAWVWKSFTRGHNSLFMDPYDGAVLGKRFDPQWEPIRRNLGHALRLARRLDMAAMIPHDDLASTKYCLADPGNAYAVYIPTGGKAKVSLGQAKNRFAVEWIHPSTGKAVAGDAVTGGADHEFAAPFDGDAVLYLSRS